MRGSPGSAPRISLFIAEHKQQQEQLMALNAVSADNAGYAAAGVSESYTGLEDGDDFGPTVVGKPKKGKGAGTGQAKRPIPTPQTAGGSKRPRRTSPGPAGGGDGALSSILGFGPGTVQSMAAASTPAPAATAAPQTPAAPWATPAPRTPAPRAAASVIDVSSQNSVHGPDSPAGLNEESVDIGRILMGAKLGRELRGVSFMFFLFQSLRCCLSSHVLLFT